MPSFPALTQALGKLPGFVCSVLTATAIAMLFAFAFALYAVFALFILVSIAVSAVAELISASLAA